MYAHSRVQVTSLVKARTPTKSTIAETMGEDFGHFPASFSFTPYSPPQVSYLWKGVTLRQKTPTVTSYDPN